MSRGSTSTIADNTEPQPTAATRARLLGSSVMPFVEAGCAAALILSLIEGVDLNIRLTPVFESFWERMALVGYFCLNGTLGALIGLVIWIATYIGSRLTQILARGSSQRPATRLRTMVAVVAVAALGAGVLYFIPEVFRYVLGSIREAEKIAFARVLLKAERLFTFLTIAAILLCCWALRFVTLECRRLPRRFVIAWNVALVAMIFAAYYVDSRVEVQQYEFSLHRSMFLLCLALALSLAASVRSLWIRKVAPDKRHGGGRPSPAGTLLSLVLAIVFGVSLGRVLTPATYDRDQNLMTQIFFRSTETKQFLKLARWMSNSR